MFIALMVSLPGCQQSPQSSDPGEFRGAPGEVKLMTLNPGHFHAALVQKTMLDQVAPTVHIFAPEGPDLELHLERIDGFNSRPDDPTAWSSEIYRGEDYLERMLRERPGNVMVTAGNNRQKTEYIKRAVDNGIQVLSDKPMAIDRQGWELLVEAFRSAEENGVLLYDIMTERYEVTSVLQRALAQVPGLFGELRRGSPDEPAIVKESVHHLFKTVAGQTLRRPPWYFDVEQQGEGIVDVTTHLVDLAMWGAFPDSPIDYRRDVEMLQASRWPTVITRAEFEQITAMPQFPDYLQDQLIDGELPYYCNGEMLFALRGHHTRISVQWDYEAPPGSNDTHFSLMRGTKSDLVIRQGAEQGYRSTLYVEPATDADREAVGRALAETVSSLQQEFPGLSYEPVPAGWELSVPDRFYLGHEAHFGKVAEAYFGYLVDGALPEWEVPNMIAKYFITTEARELALSND